MNPKYLKISEFSRVINDTLEQFVGESFFEGELQEVTVSASGHLYCNIKDEAASLSIVMWASVARSLKFKVEKGIAVRCKGRPGLYSKTGRMQVVVSSMQLAGEGLLAQRFEELKQKLAAQGLFDPARKRSLPFLPKAIGIVTSASGAVIHDIMVRLQSRMPQIPVYLIDVRVQGEGSAEEIARAIKYFSDNKSVDVIICGRGGGSLQDLWSFNEEVVVRAIFASAVPVVSAVGHEVDVTLADLAADLRAPTPTAAAEMVVPNRDDLLRNITEMHRRLSDWSRWLMPKYQELDDLSGRLSRVVGNRLQTQALNLELLNSRMLLLSPQKLLSNEINKIDRLASLLKSQIDQKINQSKFSLEKIAAKLDSKNAISNIKMQDNKLSGLAERLAYLTKQKFSSFRQNLNIFESKLDSLSPDKVLRRGYSYTLKANKLVSSRQQLKSGDEISVRFFDGSINSIVK